MELKELPKVLKKYEKVIKSVDFEKKSEKNPQIYTITLDNKYLIDGKSTDKITTSTVKLARSILRRNRVLLNKTKKEKETK